MISSITSFLSNPTFAVALSCTALLANVLTFFHRYRKDAANTRINHMFEINKVLIANPILYCVFDKEEIHGTINLSDNNLRYQIDAFFDLLTVTFENIYNDYPIKKGDTWQSWENTMKDFMRSSSMFRRHLKSKIDSPEFIYPNGFRNYVRVLLGITS